MRSVVLATYQGEPFISEQLESILAQLGPDDEVVISDDASTDGTLEAIARRRDPRIRGLTHDTRVGYVANFHMAIAASRGDRDVKAAGKADGGASVATMQSCIFLGEEGS